jgi:hypothetical protein
MGVHTRLGIVNQSSALYCAFCFVRTQKRKTTEIVDKPSMQLLKAIRPSYDVEDILKVTQFFDLAEHDHSIMITWV